VEKIMAKSVCRVLLPDTLEGAFVSIVGVLKAVNFSLQNPGNGRITTWTEDGEQVEVPGEKAIEEVVLGRIKNIQFWKADSIDFFVSWSKECSGYLFSFYIDGIHVDAAVAIVSKLLEVVLTKYRSRYGDEAAFTIKFE
jgi:hypothetical protein